MTAATPGWYADPTDPASVRYFDGENWTEHVNGAPSAAPPHEAPPDAALRTAADGTAEDVESAGPSAASRTPLIVASCAIVAVLIVVAVAAAAVLGGSGEQVERVSVRSYSVSTTSTAVSTTVAVSTTTALPAEPSTPAPAATTPAPAPAAPPATTVTPEPQPAVQLDPGGLGPLRLDMSVQDAAATGMIGPLRPGCDLGGPGELDGPLLPPFAGHVRFFDGVLFELSVDAGATTANGIGPGMSVDELMAQIDGTGWFADVDPSYDEMFGIWLGVLSDSQGGEYEFIVDPESHLVTSIHVPRVGFCE